MAKVLDFSKAKKPTLPVKLPDESTVFVCVPTKGMLEELVGIKDQLDDVVQNDRESLDVLYGLVAKMMSNNKDGRKLTAEEVAEMLDVSDVVLFFHAYTEFIAELSKEKN